MSELYFQTKGKGRSILFLHGLGSSSRIWFRLVPYLSRNYHLILIDLLGFGRSPMADTLDYSVKNHLDAIDSTVKALSTNIYAIVGHSMGALLAISYLSINKNIKKVILINPPLFRSSKEAKETVISVYPRSKYLLFTPLGRIYCGTHNALHYLFKFLLPIFFPSYPKEMVEDILFHTWKSYSFSFKNIIEDQNILQALCSFKIPTLILYGDDDKYINRDLLFEIGEKNKYIQLKKLKGKHDLPLFQAELVQREIQDFLK